MASQFSLPIFKLLTAEHSGLQFVLQKVQHFRQIQNLLAQYLDPVLLEHCHIASYQLGELIILADSPAWATHLRYLAPDLCDWLRLQPGMNKLQQVTCKVAPAKMNTKPNSTPPATKPRELPADLKAMLSGTAEEITNPKLKAALLRLAENKLKA